MANPPTSILGVVLLVGATVIPPAGAQTFISEILVNPPGTDPSKEYVELRGPASGTIAAGTYLVHIEGDNGGGQGDVKNVFDLSGLSFGSNGFLVLLQNGNSYTTNGSANVLTSGAPGFSGFTFFSADTGSDLENASGSFLLISAVAPPTLTDDIDADDNGMTDGAVFASWTVLDSVGVVDNALDAGYGAVVFAVNGLSLPTSGTIVNTSDTCGYVARAPHDTTGSTASDWVGAVIAGTAPNFTTLAGSTFPAAFDGLPLDHIGSSNFPTVPVELMRFTVD